MPAPFEYNSQPLEAVELWLCSPTLGWIDARLKIGQDSLPICFSDSYPFFADTLVWLGALINQCDAGVLDIYDEVESHYLQASYTQTADVLYLEYTRCDAQRVCLYRAAYVSKRALVEAFYWAFSFFNALDFEAEHARGNYEFHFGADQFSGELLKLDLQNLVRFLA